MSEEISIHLYDASKPDEEIIQFYSSVIPRVGDKIHYWIDYPRHMPDAHGCEPGEPVTINGTVANVRIEYRRMRWRQGEQRIVTLASVDLDNYEAKIPVPADEE